MTTTIAWSQVTVKGVVIAKSDGLELPGVTVVEKGTENATSTNIDGVFSISVSDPNATLVFSDIGFEEKEFRLKGRTEISITLKESCNIDFFDAYQINLFAISGLVHTPVGGQIEISSPYTPIGVLKGAYSYQTNLGENVFQTGQLEFSHPIYNCEFTMDFRWNFRDVSFNQDFQSKANSGEAQVNLGNINLVAGYSHLRMTRIAENINEASSGVLIGIGKELYFRPILASFSAKIAFYKNNIEYQAEFRGGYRRLQFFARYYKLDSFDEVSFGIGAQLSYFKRRKNQ
jgi:hypothetical protein